MSRTTSQGLFVIESGDPAVAVSQGMPTADSVDAAIASTRATSAQAADLIASMPTLATNLAVDPQAKTSGGTNSAVSYVLTRITTGLPAGMSYGLQTVRASTLNTVISSLFLGAKGSGNPLRWLVTAGLTYSYAAQVWCDQAGARAQISLNYFTAAGAAVGATINGTLATLPASTWARIELLAQDVPATATYVVLTVNVVTASGGGNTIAGALTLATGGQVVPGSNLPAGYADGTSTGAGWSWDGAAHASTSRKRFVTSADLGTTQGGATASDQVLKEWTAAEAFEVTNITRDSGGLVSTAVLKWPDGSAGAWATTAVNTIHAAVDAYTVTHVASGRKVTQSTVTRDTAGDIAAKPALTVGAI